MSITEKPLAYYKRIVFNSHKNEYQQNDNAAKHIVPVGDELFHYDIKEDFFSLFEQQLSAKDVHNWLLFIENPCLFQGLCSLKSDEQLLLFLKYQKGYLQADLAKEFSVSQQAISKRLKRILSALEDFF